MSEADGLLLIFGILTPLVMLFVVSSVVALTIVLLLSMYYKVYKTHMINSLPEKRLLDEIRSER